MLLKMVCFCLFCKEHWSSVAASASLMFVLSGLQDMECLGGLHLESLIEGECWYLGLAEQWESSTKLGMWNPLFGLRFICFACLQQTSTSVFTSCFLRRKIQVSVKERTTFVLFLWISWWYGRVIGWKSWGGDQLVQVHVPMHTFFYTDG